MIVSNWPEESYYGYGLNIKELRNLNKKISRPDTIREIIKRVKMYDPDMSSNSKYALVIDVNYDSFDFRFLQDLYKINSHDLIIIVSCFMDAQFAITKVNESIKQLGGDSIFYRYFSEKNIIRC